MWYVYRSIRTCTPFIDFWSHSRGFKLSVYACGIYSLCVCVCVVMSPTRYLFDFFYTDTFFIKRGGKKREREIREMGWIYSWCIFSTQVEEREKRYIYTHFTSIIWNKKIVCYELRLYKPSTSLPQPYLLFLSEAAFSEWINKIRNHLAMRDEGKYKHKRCRTLSRKGILIYGFLNPLLSLDWHLKGRTDP